MILRTLFHSILFFLFIFLTACGSSSDSNSIPAANGPDLSINITSVSKNGGNLTINYEVSNTGNTDADAFDVDLWANQVSTPVVGDAGDATIAWPGLTAGTTDTGFFILSSSDFGGMAHAIVDTADNIAESNETNNTGNASPWGVVAPVVYDFEDGVLPPEFAMSGDASFFVSTRSPGSGVYSLESGDINDSQSTCTSVSVGNASSIRYDYRASTESLYDFFQFYIDGAPQFAVTGDFTWRSTSTFTLTTGNHTFMWCYKKDFMISELLDTAWIDNIIIN